METGMLDVGTHCYYCKQLDFLPFHCNKCKHDFCTKHRLPESHHCEALTTAMTTNTTGTTPHVRNNHEKFFQSLLPAKGSERVKQQEQHSSTSSTSSHTTTIKSSLNKRSLDKLIKFFNKHKSSSKNRKQSKSKSSTISTIQLQKVARGDTKIPLQNRIYIYCYIVDDDKEDSNDAKQSEPSPIYINKIWPIGRVIDYLATQLNIKNLNLNADPNTKLILYKAANSSSSLSTGQNLIELNVNDRVNNNIHNLDTLYLIRGELKK